MKKLIIILFCSAVINLLFVVPVNAQISNKKIDSLKALIPNTTNPIERFNLLVEISESISFNAGDPDSALCVNLLHIAREQRNDSLLAISYDLIGQLSRVKGDNGIGLEYFFKAIPLAEKAHDRRRLSSIYFDIAAVYANLQNIEEYADFKTDFDESIGKINIVPQDIGRVLLNIFNNAFYATSEKLKAESLIQNAEYKPIVSIQTKKINDKIEIQVSDNGNGIPQNIIDKIFQPFFTTKPTGEGTGLGLSLAYDIITKEHNGSIAAQSQKGKYAEFIIILPTG